MNCLFIFLENIKNKQQMECSMKKMMSWFY